MLKQLNKITQTIFLFLFILATDSIFAQSRRGRIDDEQNSNISKLESEQKILKKQLQEIQSKVKDFSTKDSSHSKILEKTQKFGPLLISFRMLLLEMNVIFVIMFLLKMMFQ